MEKNRGRYTGTCRSRYLLCEHAMSYETLTQLGRPRCLLCENGWKFMSYLRVKNTASKCLTSYTTLNRFAESKLCVHPLARETLWWGMRRTGHGFGSGRSEREDGAEKMYSERERRRINQKAEISVPGIGFAVVFSRYNVFKQLATCDPTGKSKKNITDCNWLHVVNGLHMSIYTLLSCTGCATFLYMDALFLYIGMKVRERERDKRGNPLEESSWGFRGESPCCRISLQLGSPALFPRKPTLQNRSWWGRETRRRGQGVVLAGGWVQNRRVGAMKRVAENTDSRERGIWRHRHF